MTSANTTKEQHTGQDAIIFIPGLGCHSVDQTVDAISRKLRGAMDRKAKSGEAQFVLQEGQEEDYPDGQKTRLRSIIRRGKGKEETKVADVYELQYSDMLTRGFAEKRRILQILALLRVLVSQLPRLLAFLGPHKGGKSLRQKLQAAFLIVIFSLIVAYTGLLIWAAVDAFSNTKNLDAWQDGQKYIKAVLGLNEKSPKNEKSPEEGDSKLPAQQGASETEARGNPAPSGEGAKQGAGTGKVAGGQGQGDNGSPKAKPNAYADQGAKDKAILKFPQWLVLILTALAITSRKDAMATLRDAVQEYVTAIDYISLAERQSAIIGQLSSLLEHIAECGRDYDRIHIVSYSFGSLVALDSLFQRMIPGERFRQIHTLVTIGCPFDLIRTFWPDYFAGRVGHAGAPVRWLNIYSPTDVMASNFRNDQHRQEADIGISLEGKGGKEHKPRNFCYSRGIELEDLSWANLLFLVGFRVHTSYLGDPEETAISCFDPVVEELYQRDGHPALD